MKLSRVFTLGKSFCWGRRFGTGVTKTTGSSSNIPTTSLFENLKTGPLKRLYKYYTPEAINIAGGVPMDSTFPTKSVTVHLNNSDSFSCEVGENLWLNYQRGDGVPALRDWVKDHLKSIHGNPSDGEIQSCLSIGSTDAMMKIIQLIDTDVVLMDEFAYGTAVAVTAATNKRSVGVSMDKDGMIPQQLAESVHRARAMGLKANLVYLVPTGHNPTGGSMSAERKMEILSVCKKLSVMIVEDDAYYYLHYGDGAEMPGIKQLPRSLYSLDMASSTPGTVIRLDSLSKFVAPGMRLGWVAGPEAFVQKYQLLQEISSQFPCGLSQSIFLGLLEHWKQGEDCGNTGLHTHVQNIQQHYLNQRDVMVKALQDCVPQHLIEYDVPTAGMFLWLRLKLPRSVPSFEIFKHLASHGVIAVPGGDFHVSGLQDSMECVTDKVDPSVIRLTFAAATPDQIREAGLRMGRALQEY